MKSEIVKVNQFNLEDFNPDGMNPDEIMQWINFIGVGVRPQVAKQWFPEVKGQFRHVRNMRNYLWNKLTAMELRTIGRINDAIQYEKICDNIYAELPKEAKW